MTWFRPYPWAIMTIWRAGLVFCVVYFLGLIDLQQVTAFSNDRSDNLAAYWGQDSGGHQQRLSFYCQDDALDVIPTAFLYVFFGQGGKPVVDFSNICSQGGNQFPNSDLADCSFLASDIKECQSKGKLITISLGGATAKVGFSSAAQASDFAETIWDMFLGGQSSTRPFGDAVLDGIDLDIESGSPSFYSTFVDKIRALSKGSRKRYYLTAAPQCPFPDAKVGDALNNADFDAVYVQFYNNYCEISKPSEFNFATWYCITSSSSDCTNSPEAHRDHWAKTTSPNPNVKVYIGAPAGPKAAGSGYVDASALISMAKGVQSQYSSFGGVMLWDADTAFDNDRFDLQIKNAISTGQGAPKSGAPTKPGTPTKPEASTKAGALAKSSDVIASAIIPADFRDPREKARVKRPQGFSIKQQGRRSDQPKFSRFFRF
ncbi:glycoside hydrolase family 18 protein [Macrolepiota fuliginosa MF-IS2]|uniref:chitinase n=1 Tax=Macrolepiota fuliginosa MF-IS2 TaxID=1400762 RepID=A0A9P6C5J5_9AGAR|nr:glycoside hydrolase family 18 protein [Macrolepiota fuliginosa MF-IS2]